MPRPGPLRILLAVVDRSSRALLREYLRKHGCVCKIAESIQEVESLLGEQCPDLALLEIGANPISLEQLRSMAPAMTVVALAVPDPETYFHAARSGVEAVLAMPLDAHDYTPKLEPLLARLRLQPGGRAQFPQPTTEAPASGERTSPMRIPSSFATSEDMTEVRDLIEKVAPTSATVLIKGESGVGKDLAARLIHSRSRRSSMPFVKVNCAAIPNELLESELFGYEAGAFTGAIKGKPGKFELADGGTLFLDEIGEMHPTLQAKLLHVLQDGEFARLGAKRDTSVDVRVICATNKLLDVLVANGAFREDLFYRINVISVALPPLRARIREIPLLVEYFVNRYASIYGKPVDAMDAEVMQALTEYTWPGNIRELENLCKRYVIMGSTAQILRELQQKRLAGAAEDKNPVAEPLTLAGETSGPSLLEIGRRAAWAAERAAIESMLLATHWNRREAARRLNVSYKALLNKIGQMAYEPATKRHADSLK